MTDTQTIDEFDAAFAEATGSSPAPEPDASPASEAAEVTPPEPGAETQPLPEPAPTIDDIWANATPEQRAAYEAAQQESRKLTHRIQSDEGRLARYQRDRDEALKKLGAVTSVAEHEDLEAYLGSEEFQKTKADYGDDLKPVFNALETLAKRDKLLQDRFSQLDERDAEAFERTQESRLDERCKDWRDLYGHDGFSAWLETQPAHVQGAVEANRQSLADIDQVVDVAERYRAFLNPPQQTPPSPQSDHKRAAQLEASKSASVKAPVAADTTDDFDSHFKVAAAKIERQGAAFR